MSDNRNADANQEYRNAIFGPEAGGIFFSGQQENASGTGFSAGQSSMPGSYIDESGNVDPARLQEFINTAVRQQLESALASGAIPPERSQAETAVGVIPLPIPIEPPPAAPAMDPFATPIMIEPKPRTEAAEGKEGDAADHSGALPGSSIPGIAEPVAILVPTKPNANNYVNVQDLDESKTTRAMAGKKPLGEELAELDPIRENEKKYGADDPFIAYDKKIANRGFVEERPQKAEEPEYAKAESVEKAPEVPQPLAAAAVDDALPPETLEEGGLEPAPAQYAVYEPDKDIETDDAPPSNEAESMAEGLFMEGGGAVLPTRSVPLETAISDLPEASYFDSSSIMLDLEDNLTGEPVLSDEEPFVPPLEPDMEFTGIVPDFDPRAAEPATPEAAAEAAGGTPEAAETGSVVSEAETAGPTDGPALAVPPAASPSSEKTLNGLAPKKKGRRPQKTSRRKEKEKPDLMITPIMPVSEISPEPIPGVIPEEAAEAEPVTEPIAEPVIEPVPEASSKDADKPEGETAPEPIPMEIPEAPIAEPDKEATAPAAGFSGPKPYKSASALEDEFLKNEKDTFKDITVEPIGEPMEEPIIVPVGEPSREQTADAVEEPMIEAIPEPVPEPVAAPLPVPPPRRKQKSLFARPEKTPPAPKQAKAAEPGEKPVITDVAPAVIPQQEEAVPAGAPAAPEPPKKDEVWPAALIPIAEPRPFGPESPDQWRGAPRKKASSKPNRRKPANRKKAKPDRARTSKPKDVSPANEAAPKEADKDDGLSAPKKGGGGIAVLMFFLIVVAIAAVLLMLSNFGIIDFSAYAEWISNLFGN